jgi:hypothetical protein
VGLVHILNTGFEDKTHKTKIYFELLATFEFVIGCAGQEFPVTLSQ